MKSQPKKKQLNVEKQRVVSIYEAGEQCYKKLRTQLCPRCKEPMGDMPGTRDAHCHNCGFKDPCCE